MSEACTYTVDERNILVAVGGTWNRFALDNDAPELVVPSPLGRSLFDFISDRTTAELYAQVLAQVRARQRTQGFEIRCDSPSMLRVLRIDFAPAPHGGVAIASEMVREEPRTEARLLDRSVPRGDGLLELCSWCERVKVDGSWCEIEEAVDRLQLFEDEALPGLTHGICEACVERVEGEMAMTESG
jgi:hypothetical protein